MGRVDRIGQVKLTVESTAAEGTYADPAEDRLLELFKRTDAEEERERILESGPDWPTLYHLSYARENLLNWYPFEPGSRLLEIGAGCGPFSGMLADRVAHVTALELTLKRATIIAYRHQTHSNLEVVVNNMADYRPRELYSVATCIGVLEYAGKYIDDKQPYHKFLRMAGSFLKPGGQLIIAIENKMGLKYWSGAHEDHTGRPFEGIENYPFQDQIKTFGRQELKVLLAESGFANTQFYYPLPDYKLPAEVFSDDYTPEEGAPIDPSLFPAPGNDRAREHVVFEPLALQSLVSNGLFRDFVNSFLVVATKEAR
jgi:2-polyprenyl-3-methyl-5-hydroxy-6-metoxy-1,4-benzoquinol methylase